MRSSDFLSKIFDHRSEVEKKGRVGAHVAGWGRDKGKSSVLKSHEGEKRQDNGDELHGQSMDRKRQGLPRQGGSTTMIGAGFGSSDGKDKTSTSEVTTLGLSLIEIGRIISGLFLS